MAIPLYYRMNTLHFINDTRWIIDLSIPAPHMIVGPLTDVANGEHAQYRTNANADNMAHQQQTQPTRDHKTDSIIEPFTPAERQPRDLAHRLRASIRRIRNIIHTHHHAHAHASANDTEDEHERSHVHIGRLEEPEHPGVNEPIIHIDQHTEQKRERYLKRHTKGELPEDYYLNNDVERVQDHASLTQRDRQRFTKYIRYTIHR